ncbi:reverse transcriptase domain-containing protein [Picosynechococcus sp. PCC 8807]|uniref:reverse transcriptase domain-containing protein n=1 Tax=Picosynechococcus sp. PCC 8807 TaxID=195248 RepID=UPI000810752E|nr:reverse transcriptase domain-containing protein [Picosynechococcus sp. PCC 8807]ANV90066.1 hypothetical protein AWQ24_05175 [Picosynechococcus sp. PCC 8807]
MRNQKTIFLEGKTDDLQQDFLKVLNNRDLAKLLEISYPQLIYYSLKTINSDTRYRTFQIQKKTKGTRTICVPNKSLKILQTKISQILYSIYTPKSCVHGYVFGKNMITNAAAHRRKAFVLNLDIQDFFGSINLGRVRGLLMAEPFSLSNTVATTISNLCCYQNKLPQGSPSSPILSNLICQKLDRELSHFAKKHRFYYTRYADDITFSSKSLDALPFLIKNLDLVKEKYPILLSDELEYIFTSNGFTLNQNKIRILYPHQKQQVTGLVVNKKLNVNRKYIRNLRAALYAWEEFGLEKTSQVYLEKYAKTPTLKQKKKSPFVEAIRGKIEFLKNVRGKSDPITQKFLDKYSELYSRDVTQAKDDQDSQST